MVTRVGEESFTDLDYTDDVFLFAEMLQTLVTGHTYMYSLSLMGFNDF